MRNLLNTPEMFVDEVLESLALSNRTRARALKEEPPALVSVSGNSGGRVTFATAGRSRPSPLLVGYVARGLADDCGTRSLAPSPNTNQTLSLTPCDQRRTRTPLPISTPDVTSRSIRSAPSSISQQRRLVYCRGLLTSAARRRLSTASREQMKSTQKTERT
jgi:hypothetical protein